MWLRWIFFKKYWYISWSPLSSSLHLETSTSWINPTNSTPLLNCISHNSQQQPRFSHLQNIPNTAQDALSAFDSLCLPSFASDACQPSRKSPNFLFFQKLLVHMLIRRHSASPKKARFLYQTTYSNFCSDFHFRWGRSYSTRDFCNIQYNCCHVI